MSKSFVVTERTYKYADKPPWHSGICREPIIREEKYDNIEWEDWYADVYQNGSCKLFYTYGEGYTPLAHDDIPTLIALLIMIYTNSYKKEVQ